jgi:hypothetical protein
MSTMREPRYGTDIGRGAECERHAEATRFAVADEEVKGMYLIKARR